MISHPSFKLILALHMGALFCFATLTVQEASAQPFPTRAGQQAARPTQGAQPEAVSGTSPAGGHSSRSAPQWLTYGANDLHRCSLDLSSLLLDGQDILQVSVLVEPVADATGRDGGRTQVLGVQIDCGNRLIRTLADAPDGQGGDWAGFLSGSMEESLWLTACSLRGRARGVAASRADQSPPENVAPAVRPKGDQPKADQPRADQPKADQPRADQPRKQPPRPRRVPGQNPADSPEAQVRPRAPVPFVPTPSQ